MTRGIGTSPGAALVAAVCVGLAGGALACADAGSDGPASPDAAGFDDAAASDADTMPDAAPPPDVAVLGKGPAIGIDNIDLVGRSNLFALLGSLYNGTLDTAIADGTLLQAIVFRALDDPAGQDDDAIEIGLYECLDYDGDPGDNFDAVNPDGWVAAPMTEDPPGTPKVLLSGQVTDGILFAQGSDVVELQFSSFLFPLHQPNLRGSLAPAPDAASVYYLEDGLDQGLLVAATLSGTVPMSFFGEMDNLLEGAGCPGITLLDVAALGCESFGIWPAQPDGDLDADGFEVLCDACTDAPCADKLGGGTDYGEPGAAGRISCCIDGDGTLYLGDDCWNAPAFADGYIADFRLHGTRVIVGD